MTTNKHNAAGVPGSRKADTGRPDGFVQFIMHSKRVDEATATIWAKEVREIQQRRLARKTRVVSKELLCRDDHGTGIRCCDLPENQGVAKATVVTAQLLQRPRFGGGGSGWEDASGSLLTADEVQTLPFGTLARLRMRRLLGGDDA